MGLSKLSKKIVQQKVKTIIYAHDEIIFGYVFGSFAEKEDYQDIDLAVYLDENHPRVANNLFYDLELSSEIEKRIKIPVDIIILNRASDSIVYRVSKGILLKDTSEELRTEFILFRWKKYLDFREVIKKYGQELKSASR